MELKLINIEEKNIIGEARISVPNEWLASERDRCLFVDGLVVNVYEGNSSRPAIPAWQIEIPHDYEEVALMNLAIEIPEELVSEIKIGRPVWRTEYLDDGYRTKESFYYEDEFKEYLESHPDASWYSTVEYDEWSPKCWEYRYGVDPAFSTTFTSGERFSTKEEAEAYGREHFGEEYAGVEQVGFSVDPKKGLL